MEQTFACKNCGKIFPQLKKCVCPACGKTQHEFPEYYICPVCGKRSVSFPTCHKSGLMLYVKPRQECKCSRCSQTFHEFHNHRCIHCSEWEVHEHEALSYNLIYKENKLRYGYRCCICHEEFVQENKPKQAIVREARDWKLQPFVFCNGSRAYSVQELVELCYQYPEDGCYHLLEGHFEPWLRYLADADRSSIENSDSYKIASVCSELRSQNNECSPRQKLDTFIARSCKSLYRFESDGQSWVAGWE